MSETKWVPLWCEAGQHKWERKSQRGKRPRNCKEHAAQAAAERREEREADPTQRTLNPATERAMDALDHLTGEDHRKVTYIAEQLLSMRRSAKDEAQLVLSLNDVLRVRPRARKRDADLLQMGG